MEAPKSATGTSTAAPWTNNIMNTNGFTSVEVENCAMDVDQYAHSTVFKAQHPSTIKQETGATTASSSTTAIITSSSEKKSKLQFDNLISHRWTESDETNHIISDTSDIIKTEGELFCSENKDDEGSADEIRVMESMQQAVNLTEPCLHQPEFPDRLAEMRVKRADSAGDLLRQSYISIEVGSDQPTMAGECDHEKGRARNSGKGEVLEGRRVTRGLKTEDLMDLRVQFMTSVCDSKTAASAVTPVKSKCKRKYSQSRVIKKQRSGTPVKRQNDPSVTTCKVDISREVVQQWRHIGSERGLATDTDIATFLVKHYRDVGERRCVKCQSPLRLVCHKCPPPPSSPPHNSLSTTLSLLEPPPPQTSPPPPVSSPGMSDEVEEDVAVESSSPQLNQVPKPSPRKRRKCGKRVCSHVCPECGSQFARSGGLKVHMRIHTGEKPYVCSECGQGFSQSGQLTVHMRKHKGERPYVCSVCPASFPLAGSLKQHMRVHTGDRPYACSHCPRRFSYAGDLTVHMRKHTGDRPFLCSDCGKSFAVSSDLSKHKRIHSDHRPFKCSVCHKGFPFLNRLTLHMRTHTGDKPFLCADCGSSFSRASNLTVHRRVHHTFEKPFICPYCQHAFADSANLSKHKKNKHGKHRTELQPPAPPPSVPEEYTPQALVSVACNGVADSEVCQRGSMTGQPAVMGQASGQLETSGEGEVGGQVVAGSVVGSGPVFPFYNYYYHQQNATHQY